MVKHVTTTYRRTSTSCLKRKYVTRRRSPSATRNNSKNGGNNPRRRSLSVTQANLKNGSNNPRRLQSASRSNLKNGGNNPRRISPSATRSNLKNMGNNPRRRSPSATRSNLKNGSNNPRRRSQSATRSNLKNGDNNPRRSPSATRNNLKNVGNNPRRRSPSATRSNLNNGYNNHKRVVKRETSKECKYHNINGITNGFKKNTNDIKQNKGSTKSLLYSKCDPKNGTSIINGTIRPRVCKGSETNLVNSTINSTHNTTIKTINRIKRKYTTKKSAPETNLVNSTINSTHNTTIKTINRIKRKYTTRKSAQSTYLLRNGAERSILSATSKTLGKIKHNYSNRKHTRYEARNGGVDSATIIAEKRIQKEVENGTCDSFANATMIGELKQKNFTKKMLPNSKQSLDTDVNSCNYTNVEKEVETIPERSNIIKPVFRYIKCRTCRVPCDGSVIKKLKSFDSESLNKIDVGTDLGAHVRKTNSDPVPDESAISVSVEPNVSNNNFEEIKNTICNNFSIKLVNEYTNFSNYLTGPDGDLNDEKTAAYDNSKYLPFKAVDSNCLNEKDNKMKYTSEPGGNEDTLTSNELSEKVVNHQVVEHALCSNDDYDYNTKNVVNILHKHKCSSNDSEQMHMQHMPDENGNFMDNNFGNQQQGLQDHKFNAAAAENKMYRNKENNSDVTTEGMDAKIETHVNTDLLKDMNGNNICIEQSKNNGIITPEEECIHCENVNDDYQPCKCCVLSFGCSSKYIADRKEVDVKKNNSIYYCKEQKLIHCRKHVRLKQQENNNTRRSPRSHITSTTLNDHREIFNCNYILQSTQRLNLLHSRIFHSSITSLNENITRRMLADAEIDIELFNEDDIKESIRGEINEDIREDIINDDINGDIKDDISYFTNKCEWHDCNELFNDSNKLLDHLKEEHICPMSTNSVFICLWRKCKFINHPSSSYKWLMKHVLRHCCVRPFKCMISGCESSFATQNGLARHVPSHFNEGKVRRTCVLTSTDKSLTAEQGMKNKMDVDNVDNGEDTDESSEPIRKRSRYEKFVDKYKGRSTGVRDDQGVLNNIKYRLQLGACDSPVNCGCGFVGQFFRINHKIIGRRTCTDGSMDMLLSPSSTKMFPLKSFWFDGRTLEREKSLSEREKSVNEREKSLIVDINVNNLSDGIKQQLYDNEQSFRVFKKGIRNFNR